MNKRQRKKLNKRWWTPERLSALRKVLDQVEKSGWEFDRAVDRLVYHSAGQLAVQRLAVDLSR